MEALKLKALLPTLYRYISSPTQKNRLPHYLIHKPFRQDLELCTSDAYQTHQNCQKSPKLCSLKQVGLIPEYPYSCYKITLHLG